MNIQDKLAYFRKKVVELPLRREGLTFAAEFMCNSDWQQIYMHKRIWEGGTHGGYVQGYTPKPEQMELEINVNADAWEALQK